ncbi:DUF6176 family protein [Mesorhizobium sp. WSM2239]|uniref:DUF6176 family protein n=2 Tax=unclassified Mesorhizobium TaxID=325217 RepID=A0AAU8DGA6_9HYPH
MNYLATKIRVTCDEVTVWAWAAYMTEHLDEVSLALRNESVRHEMWFMGRDWSLFVLGVMDVDDHPGSQAVSAKSELSVDEVHKNFKAFWSSAERLSIDPAKSPRFEDCEFLFEAYA